MRVTIATIAALATLAVVVPATRAGQEEQFTPEFRGLHKTYDAKHTPKLTAPDSVKRGQWFDVTVTVGAGGEHPSLAEHHVRYIALDESGTLRALAEPTHSAAWEASKRINVAP